MSTPPQSSTPTTPLQQIHLTEDDFHNPSQLINLLNSNMTNLYQMLNSLTGYGGTIKLNNHLDLGGNKITNVGAAESPTDVVTQAVGNSRYGADAIRPQIEALGKHVMQSYRRLSDIRQREKYSSFLNQVMNTSPTANTSNISFGTPSGGSVAVSITGGLHQRVDGSQVPYSPRTDTLSLPSTLNIISISRTSGIVTATISSTSGLSVGSSVSVAGVTDPSFDGVFGLIAPVGSGTITYSQTGLGLSNASSSGGNVSAGKTYYYTLSHGQTTLGLQGPFGADTWSTRVGASLDGTTIIAVVVLNGSGGDTTNSAAGATSPTQGASIPVIRRL